MVDGNRDRLDLYMPPMLIGPMPKVFRHWAYRYNLIPIVSIAIEILLSSE